MASHLRHQHRLERNHRRCLLLAATGTFNLRRQQSCLQQQLKLNHRCRLLLAATMASHLRHQHRLELNHRHRLLLAATVTSNLHRQQSCFQQLQAHCRRLFRFLIQKSIMELAANLRLQVCPKKHSNLRRRQWRVLLPNHATTRLNFEGRRLFLVALLAPVHLHQRSCSHSLRVCSGSTMEWNLALQLPDRLRSKHQMQATDTHLSQRLQILVSLSQLLLHLIYTNFEALLQYTAQVGQTFGSNPLHKHCQQQRYGIFLHNRISLRFQHQNGCAIMKLIP
jgi:hypothetical protein